MCGNLDLQRISSDHGTGMFSWLFRLLHFPAYRCAPCRNRFFSVRIYRRIVPTPLPLQPAADTEPAVNWNA
jgi:hypothetical protein